MLGGMQDWPLRIIRILDHAAREHGTRELVQQRLLVSTRRRRLRSSMSRPASR